MIELRQYTLHPGMRERLLAQFDAQFIESQEAAGIRVIGHFRDADRLDYFVWLRGFADMAARERALHAFPPRTTSTAWRATPPTARRSPSSTPASAQSLRLAPVGRSALR